MKVININHLDDYEDTFLSHMRIDLREKIQNTKVFLFLNVKDESEIINCTEGIIMRDADNLCDTRKSFNNIEFEIISNDELENYPKEYFVGKFILQTSDAD